MSERDLDTITYADDWELKSEAERRRWALQCVGIHNRPVSDCIADADRVLAYINGQPSPPLREAA